MIDFYYRVAVWDISDELDSVLQNVDVETDPTKPAIKLTEPLGFYQVHMSGVNALAVTEFDKDTLLIMTGGEDNAVAAVLVDKTDGKMVGDGPCIVSNAHASSVNGLYIVNSGEKCHQKKNITVASVSTDQRLNIWSAAMVVAPSDNNIDDDDQASFELELVDSIFVDIPDPSALGGVQIK